MKMRRIFSGVIAMLGLTVAGLVATPSCPATAVRRYRCGGDLRGGAVV
jgi:hypothetical protein